MASPSGASSGSSSLQNSGSDQGQLQQNDIEQRKRKRMLSNRESARRSRMKKQQHLNDLIGQVGELRKENDQIITRLGITTQLYQNIEAENAILRTQMAELGSRLQSLNEIRGHINSSNYLFHEVEETQNSDWGFIMNPWNQPIMASANMLMHR